MNPKQKTTDNIVAFPKTQQPVTEAPYSQEAEEAVIGALLIDPKAFVRVRPLLNADDFFFLRHGYIFQAMDALYSRGEPIDIIPLTHELDAVMGKLKEIGGIAYLTQVMSSTPTSQHAEVYAAMVQRAAASRRIMRAADEIKALGMDQTLPVEARRERAIELLLSTPDVSADKVEHVSATISRNWDMVEQAMNNPQQAQGVPTGLKDLDSLLDGLHRRKLYVMAGINHHGKTSAMMTMALNAARSGARVAYFNVADGDEQDVITRIIGMDAGIAPKKIMKGTVTSAEYSRYTEAAGRIAKLPLFLRSKKGMTPRQIYDSGNQIKHLAGGLDVVFIDYIQRITLGDHTSKFKSQYDQMAYISQQMTIIGDAKHLNCAIVVGAQINRAGAKQGKNPKPPTRSNIKGCGNIEEDADGVMIVYYEAVENKEAFHPDLVQIIIEKNKVTGELGNVWTQIDKETTRLMNWRENRKTSE